jgi:hypothetical protein
MAGIDVLWLRGVGTQSTKGQEHVSEPDSKGPLFFLSYARTKPLRDALDSQPNPNRRVYQLFNDLSTHLNNLVYRETGADDPGYVDRSMRGSEVWTDDLRSALGSCQVLVALLSPAYVQSEWCAREWNGFASRPVRRREGATGRRSTSIIPVVWASPKLFKAPPAIRRVQFFSPVRLSSATLAQEYHDEGLYNLLSIGTPGTDGIVLRLAQRIVELAGDNDVGPLDLDFDSVSPTFGEAK